MIDHAHRVFEVHPGIWAKLCQTIKDAMQTFERRWKYFGSHIRILKLKQEYFEENQRTGVPCLSPENILSPLTISASIWSVAEKAHQI